MTDTDALVHDEDLDVRGLNCPLPILRTKKALADLAPGTRLRVRATDPHSVIDFTAFCARSPHELLSHHEADGEYHFLLRKGPPATG
ncbi:preprotein translocase subunit TatC [Spiribacter halobius]|uniref:Preprotein translocase subunit TatC n=2 Tax=Sediminicurvatus halobius TaxID=2182432 RepID=A0A2U2MZ06_9GAMM|nr:preprotein translocase subunit TatC [Spiribacter halobius]